MKRAKIMLLAILVVATVGGALAFKAQKFLKKNVYCLTTTATNICVTTPIPFQTTPIAGQVGFTTPCAVFHPTTFKTIYYTTASCGKTFNGTVYTTNVD